MADQELLQLIARLREEKQALEQRLNRQPLQVEQWSQRILGARNLEQVELLLGELALAVGAEYASLLTSEDGELYNVEACFPLISTSEKVHLRYNKSLFPWVINELENSRAVIFTHLEEVVGHSPKDIESYHLFGHRSAVVVPISTNRRHMACIDLHTRTREHVWLERDIELVQILAPVFFNAILQLLKRKEDDEALYLLNDVLRTTDVFYGTFSPDLREFSFGYNARQILDFSARDEISPQAIIQRMPEDSLKEREIWWRKLCKESDCSPIVLELLDRKGKSRFFRCTPAILQYTSNQRPERILVGFVDVTAQQQYINDQQWISETLAELHSQQTLPAIQATADKLRERLGASEVWFSHNGDDIAVSISDLLIVDLTSQEILDAVAGLRHDYIEYLAEKHIVYFDGIENLPKDLIERPDVYDRCQILGLCGGYGINFHPSAKESYSMVATWDSAHPVPPREHVDTLCQLLGNAMTSTLDQVIAQQALESARNEAEQANRAKSDFLARMSHEIRTPMNAILGLSHLMFDTTMTDSQRDYISHIDSAANNLLGIINDILDFSKIEAGKFELDEQGFELRAVIENVIKIMEFQAKEKSLYLQVELDEKLPSYVKGDQLRLTQVLINLLGNAIKFTPRGGVQLRLKLFAQHNDQIELQIFIVDTGVGIKNEYIPDLFSPFTQADGSTSRNFGGTGLGLTITRSLIQLMGGSIVASSLKGQGTTFRIQLSLPVVEALEERPLQGVSAIKPSLDTNLLEGLHVLVAEDNIVNQKVAGGILKKKGVHCTFANNGQEAIDAIRHQPDAYAAILMDIEMPRVNGYDATRCIRNELQYRRPIIAMTAHAIDGDQDKALSAGMDAYLTKPIQPLKLYQSLERYCCNPDGV